MIMSDSLPRRSLYILFVLSIAGVVLAVVLMALLAGLGYMGFDGNSQVSGTCTGYFLNKYSQTAMIEEVAFIFSILSLAAFSAVLILMVRCFLEANKSEEQDVFINRCTKISLYVLTSVAIMCAIPPFGYYLSIVAEINGCSSASYDTSKVPAILAMAALLLLLLLAFFLFLFFVFCCGSSEEKYQEVSRRHTERNEDVKKAEEVQYLNKKRI
jgi:cytochrome bd-type quinol oxidase subunit 2